MTRLEGESSAHYMLRLRTELYKEEWMKLKNNPAWKRMGLKKEYRVRYEVVQQLLNELEEIET